MRKALCGEVEKHEIVPVSPERDIAVSHEQISLSVGNVVVSLPDDLNSDTLKRLLELLLTVLPSMEYLTNPDILEELMPWNEAVKNLCEFRQMFIPEACWCGSFFCGVVDYLAGTLFLKKIHQPRL